MELFFRLPLCTLMTDILHILECEHPILMSLIYAIVIFKNDIDKNRSKILLVQNVNQTLICRKLEDMR